MDVPLARAIHEWNDKVLNSTDVVHGCVRSRVPLTDCVCTCHGTYTIIIQKHFTERYILRSDVHRIKY